MYNPKYITKEGNRFLLTPEGERWLRERFPTTLNSELLAALGIHRDTLLKFRAMLGLKKDEAFKQQVLKGCMAHACSVLAAQMEADPERFKAIYKRRGKRIMMQRRADVVRIMSGEKPRYNFRHSEGHQRECANVRRALHYYGYVPYTQYACKQWYFALETRRCLKLEQKARAFGYTFYCFR